MNTKKKMLSGLLALMLVFGAGVHSVPLLSELTSPVSASADNYNGFEYNNLDGSIFITGYTGTEKDLTVPGEIDGCPVVSVASEAFKNNTRIESVTFSDGLFSLADSVFEGCTSLKKVTLPDGLMNIGCWTFLSCISLTGINIPDTVYSMGPFAFDSCTSLKEIHIPAYAWNIDPNNFRRCQSLTNFDVSPDSASYCSVNGMLYSQDKKTLLKAPGGLTEAVIPEGTEVIAEDAFRDSPKLSSVTIPDSVTEIEKYAFYDCPELKTVVIPASVKEIGENAISFYYDYKTVVKTKVPDIMLYLYKDTAALTYAQDNELPFILLDDQEIIVKVSARSKKAVDLSDARICFMDKKGDLLDITGAPDDNGLFMTADLAEEEGDFFAVGMLNGFVTSSVSFHYTPGEVTEVEIVLVQLGDVNGDGTVNLKDYVLLQRWLNKWDVEINEDAANMDGNSKINLKDLVKLRRVLTGWEVLT